MTTAIARGGSRCTCDEEGILTTSATVHDCCCINSWATELADVDWAIHDDVSGKNWGDLVLGNDAIGLLIAHGEMFC
ncbi:hypothetical protein BOTCAL_0189g00100 [Botryotinia calthae]|uniref:Uncharacterized protein n=1 Tax=Botryotinia calthae TaxID=38488 RepID=A0A4Y8D0K9_9HELO|nr:hypothetical protein BOTCAL_0189g00100 [Botryotinia calthae]